MPPQLFSYFTPLYRQGRKSSRYSNYTQKIINGRGDLQIASTVDTW
ncbi:MAG TPA: hypothetical protein V6D27_05355 [Vampirovibrionales bacterium]